MSEQDQAGTKQEIELAADQKRKKNIATINALIEKVDGKNPTRNEIKAFKSALPILDKLYDSMAVYNEKQLVKMLAKDESYQMVMQYKVDEMKVGLGYNEASVMERLLIEQVALSWLRLQLTESRLTIAEKERPIRMIKFYDERTSAAQRRFLRAAESLAKVRKLMTQTPALQINIAQQQVNQLNTMEK